MTNTPASAMPSPTSQMKAAATTVTPLPDDYSPSPTTVIVGRGHKVKRHPGNWNLTAIVRSELAEYSKAEKTLKSFILMRVLKRIRDTNPDKIAFVKQDLKTGKWMSLPLRHARTCVAQEFRDALHDTYRSSKHSKQLRRMQEKGHDMVPTNGDAPSSLCAYTDTPPMAGGGGNSLLSSLAQGFDHRHANSKSSQRESFSRIRGLIHVPSREPSGAPIARRVSYMPEKMAHQGGSSFGYGRTAGYDLGDFRPNQMFMGSMPPTMPSMYSMCGMHQAPMMEHFQLPLGNEPAPAVPSNSDVHHHDSIFDTLLGSEDPFFSEEDDDDSPLDLMVFHELPVSVVQRALQTNPIA